MRNRAGKWLLWVILIVVGVPFVFWGVQDYPSFLGGNYIARADGISIGPGELERAFESQYARISTLFGAKFQPTPAELATIRHETLETLIQRTLLLARARRDGLRVTKAEMIHAIRAVPAFRSGGHFSPALYEEVLNEENLTPVTFENEVRESLLLGQLQTGIETTSFLPPASVLDRYRVSHETRPVRWVVISSKRFLHPHSISNAAIKKAYAEQSYRFVNPGKVTLSYVMLDARSLRARIHPTLRDLLTLYAEEESKFTSTPHWKVAQILIARRPGQNGPAKTKRLAQTLVAQLAHGAHFGALARKDSSDAASAAHGGDLGWLTPKNIPAALVRVLKRMKVGEVKGPLPTPFGYQIVKLLAARPVKRLAFKSVRAKLVQQYRVKAAIRLYHRLLHQMANLAFEQDTTLKPLSSTLGLAVGQVSGVTREQGTGIARIAKVRQAAFAPTVLAGGLNSKPIRLPGHRAVVLRVVAHTPAVAKPLSAVRPILVRELAEQSARAEARGIADRIANRLRKNPRQTHILGFKVQGPFTVSLAGGALRHFSPALVKAVFALPNPAHPGSSRVRVVKLPNGNAAVIAAGPIETLSRSRITPKMLAKWTQSAQNDDARLEMQLFLNELERTGKIRINQKALQSAT
ncbi:MAG: SurA N-terminal domain-containing protein [Gammaproteobacteria bacterium]